VVSRTAIVSGLNAIVLALIESGLGEVSFGVDTRRPSYEYTKICMPSESRKYLDCIDDDSDTHTHARAMIRADTVLFRLNDDAYRHVAQVEVGWMA
jgi:hypothetical protein